MMSVHPRTIALKNGETVIRWETCIFHHGRRIRESCGPNCHSETRAKAIEVQRRLKLERQGSTVWTGKIPSLTEAAEQFLESVEAAHAAKNLAANTLRHYRNAWETWLAPTELANMRVDRITSGVISAVEFPGGPFTRKNARQCLGRILNWCAEELGCIVAAPKIKSTRVVGRKMRITADIEHALRAHMKRDVADVLTMMLDDLMRNCEVFAMEWSRIDWERGEYHVAKSKSPASQRTIPLSDRAIAMLKARKATAKSQWVFPSRIGKVGHITTVAKQFREARAAAGVDARIKPYNARHTGASELSEKGVDLLTLRQFLGHENISTTNAYLHGDAEKAREAVNSKQRDRTGLRLEKRA